MIDAESELSAGVGIGGVGHHGCRVGHDAGCSCRDHPNLHHGVERCSVGEARRRALNTVGGVGAVDTRPGKVPITSNAAGMVSLTTRLRRQVGTMVGDVEDPVELVAGSRREACDTDLSIDKLALRTTRVVSSSVAVTTSGRRAVAPRQRRV